MVEGDEVVEVAVAAVPAGGFAFKSARNAANSNSSSFGKRLMAVHSLVVLMVQRHSICARR